MPNTRVKRLSNKPNPNVGAAKAAAAIVSANLPGQGKSRSARRRRARKTPGVSLGSVAATIERFVPQRLFTRRKAFTNVLNSNLTSPYGDQIVVVEGSLPLTNVQSNNSTQLVGSGTTPLGVPISPALVGGTLSQLADRFNKYFFTSLVFEYVPYQPNSTEGHGFAFAYNPDGYEEYNVVPDYIDVATFEHSMFVPMTGYIGGREENMLIVTPSRKTSTWYFNDDDSQAPQNAGPRLSTQGTFFGVSDSSATPMTWGSIWLHYTIELCDITPATGILSRSLKREGRSEEGRVKLKSLLGEILEIDLLDARLDPVEGHDKLQAVVAQTPRPGVPVRMWK